MKQFFFTNKNNWWFWLFLIITISSLILLPILSKDAGNSGDEQSHHQQAQYVYDYYHSLGKDTMALTPRASDYNQPYYGQLADNISYYVAKTFSIENEYAVRHIVNSLFGWIMMLFAALIAYRIAGWRAAVLTFILMFCSPRLLGHSFNNLKDVPFASMMIMAIYYMIRILQEFPNIKIFTAVMLALSIGCAIAVRVGGLLLFPYFVLFALICFIIRNYRTPGLRSKIAFKEFGRFLIWGVGISIVGYFIAILLWPFAMQKPIDNVVFVFKNMSSFAIAIRQLFEGTLQWSDALPWYYTPKYIFMTIPVAVIIGFILNLIFLWRDKKNYFWQFIVLFTCIFPIFWIVVTNANVYGGWRHAMFAYPPMVVAAGLGFNYLVLWIETKWGGLKQTTPVTAPAVEVTETAQKNQISGTQKSKKSKH